MSPHGGRVPALFWEIRNDGPAATTLAIFNLSLYIYIPPVPYPAFRG